MLNEKMLAKALENKKAVNELMKASNSNERIETLRKYHMALKLVPTPKLNRYLNENLHNVLNYSGILQAYFSSVLQDDQSITDFQAVLDKEAESLRPIRDRDHSEIVALFEGSFSKDPQGWLIEQHEQGNFTSMDESKLKYFHDSIVTIANVYLERDTNHHCSLHGAGKLRPQIMLLKDFLHISQRELNEQEILQLEIFVIEWCLRTEIGQRLMHMIMDNMAIEDAFESHRSYSITTTNYHVPQANYWMWELGNSEPVRKPTLSTEDSQRAKRLYEEEKYRVKVSPWIEAE